MPDRNQEHTEPPSHQSDLVIAVKNEEKNLNIKEIIQKDEWQHRKRISLDIVNVFRIINVFVLLMILFMFSAESFMVFQHGTGYNRIVDNKVIIALIGATTIQFGAIALAVSSWLFPKNN